MALSALLLLSTTLLPSLTTASTTTSASTTSDPLPLLIWHGLGDKHDNPGLHAVGALANTSHPGTKVYYIRTAEDGGADRTGSFFGDLHNQTAEICAALGEEFGSGSERHGGGGVRVDALGFSQGGQFLRGLVQTCDAVSVRSLVTFGSQHNGIADVKPCGTWDLLCKGAVALMRGNVWSESVQRKVVPAQYFRTLNETTGEASAVYLEHSHWLAGMNNERELKNETYKRRIAALERFVMVLFEEDTTVVPKESGWFAEVNRTSGDVTPLRERPIYKEDWLGLKELDSKGGLVFLTNSGDHMQLDENLLKAVFKKYFGPERSAGTNGPDLDEIPAFEGIRLQPDAHTRSGPGAMPHNFL